MAIVPKFIVRFFVKDSTLYKNLQALLGFTPGDESLYELALCHSSFNKDITENNERLEFLGDAILGSIIGEYLFHKYPTKPEGYLTDMRSKIVNRKSLNDIGKKIGLEELMSFNEKDYHLRHSPIFGNAFEALIGAIYLDKGYVKTKKFVQKRMLIPFIDIESLEDLEANIKNKLIGWANRESKELEFVDLDCQQVNGRKRFFVGVQIDGQLVGNGNAMTKKEASKLAAEDAIRVLDV
jgi:ribonuclease III